MTEIVLVRHGETESNRMGLFRGRLDVPLNEVEELFNELGNRYGFAPTSVHFALVGTCADCAQLKADQS